MFKVRKGISQKTNQEYKSLYYVKKLNGNWEHQFITFDLNIIEKMLSTGIATYYKEKNENIHFKENANN